MTQVNAPVKNLLVIDSQVSNWQSLAAGVGTDTAVLILDSGSDGLSQISAYLTKLAASTPDFTPLQSLQIISHGSAGSLLLGSSTLTTGSLKQYTSQLASIGNSLTATGDILLYGCNVAAGQSGLDFINLFSTLTNADVAASNDVTGSTALGGNWQLEASTGAIEAASALSANTQVTYAGSLATAIPVVTVTAGIKPIEGAIGSFTVTLDSPAPAGGLTINYRLSGTATLNTDYTVTAGANISAVTNGSLTIAEGQTTASLTINAAGLDGYDPNETIDISLQIGSGYSFVRNVATFASKEDFATGNTTGNAMSVGIGDFNGDGKTDLAIAHYYSNTVSVLLRNAANTGFDPKVDVANGYSVNSLSVGDFNGDGKLDLAIANENSNTVSVLLRNTTNTGFDPKVDFATGSDPHSVSIGDFNGDGKTDLAVANSSSGTVSVLLRNAANTGFDPKVDIANGSISYRLSVGDFNGDGKQDLAVANPYSDTVSVLLRNAANTGFDPKVDFATGSYPSSVSVGDFNGDGNFDLAIANISSGTVSVLLRNSANTGFDPKVDIATGSFPQSVSVGDFNGDGKLDLAVANYNGSTVSVLLRNAANTGFDPKVDVATDSHPQSVSIGDFNGDGKLDLAVANSYSLVEVSVLLNNTIPNASLTITDNNPVNIAPTLTAFTSTVASGNSDNQIAISFTNLQTQGNEADVDGTVSAFIIKAVSTGTLLIGASTGTATAWNASTNNSIDPIHTAYWTPAANANGSLNAFTAVAKDNGGLESVTAIQATVAVIDPIPPTVTGFSPADGNTGAALASNIVLTFSEIIQKGAGLIQLHSGSATGTVIESFDAASSNRLALSGNTLTIDPTNNLANNTQYFVTFDSGSVKDLAGNNYAGISSYDFTTVSSETNGDDSIKGTGSDDIINALAGNDSIYSSLGNDRIDGGTGNDTVLYDFNKSAITEVGRATDGTLMIQSAKGTDTLLNIENLSFMDGGLSINELLAQSAPVPLFTSSASDGTSSYVMPTKYSGSVNFLEYELLGKATGDVITGSIDNDFMNLLGGDDAANGGAGDDVLDGGTGSNFLTGGSGNDTIFLDGRGGTTTWSTVTDFSAGDQVNIWGWNAGVSKQVFAMENQGADGYKGATFHYDLNNDGLIDTSITLTGLALSQVPTGVAHTVAGNGYLLIG